MNDGGLKNGPQSLDSAGPEGVLSRAWKRLSGVEAVGEEPEALRSSGS